MRMRVTISRSVLYQMNGPLLTTIQGSTTPTQMECSQLGRVGAVQSSPITPSSWPVPCVQMCGCQDLFGIVLGWRRRSTTTQMECNQHGSVGAVQSSPPTPSSWPVPCMHMCVVVHTRKNRIFRDPESRVERNRDNSISEERADCLSTHIIGDRMHALLDLHKLSHTPSSSAQIPGSR